MDRIITEDRRFAAGNPQTGVPGTIVTARWLNNVQEEIANVIEGADIALEDASQDQLLQAIQHIVAVATSKIGYEPTTPAIKKAPLIFVADRWQWAVWVETAFYTGYRSLQCGDWYIGSMSQMPRPHEIDGIGGIYDIAAFPSLWGWANENGHVVNAGDWTAGWTHYAKIGATQFRVPDYRNMFPRVAGTDADTANARLPGSKQSDALQKITGSFITSYAGLAGAFNASNSGVGLDFAGGANFYGTLSFDASRVVRTSTETRATNNTVAPVILA